MKQPLINNIYYNRARKEITVHLLMRYYWLQKRLIEAVKIFLFKLLMSIYTLF